MRILVAHNRYQQMGGEDVVFDTESRAIEALGHQVERFTVDNSQIRNLQDKVRATLSVSRNEESIRRFKAAVRDFQPDIVHVHNFFPLLTPAALAESAKLGIPVIQTLHNYRALCANSMFFRDGKVCESCLTGSRLAGMAHRCYRNSAVGSFAISRMGANLQRIAKRYPNLLTFIALTNFAKSRYVAGGFDEMQIEVKANGLPDPGEGTGERQRRILFVGRLSPEKGVDTLIRAANRIDGEIVIIGDGPERASLSKALPPNVTMMGSLPRSEIFEQLKRATAIAVPSRWYEACPMTILEAFGTGTPVIASRLGALAELVEDGRTGLLAGANQVDEWASAASALLSNPSLAREMGRRARATYLERYTEEANMRGLMDIYASALARSKVQALAGDRGYARMSEAGIG